MKVARFISMLLLTVLTFNSIYAQANESLKGVWKAVYNEDGEKGIVTYEIKSEDGELIGFTKYIRDDQGNGEEYKSLALKNIRFYDNIGKATYMVEYEGETYNTKASLELEDLNTLKVSYSYMGYSDVETWKRVQ